MFSSAGPKGRFKGSTRAVGAGWAETRLGSTVRRVAAATSKPVQTQSRAMLAVRVRRETDISPAL
ncbi:hypothetical protein [Nannocystis exedens]|uniref:hypothetical protein n=1 Tax=Nannocystis exedens TaxID=54 RepID=UPI001B80C0EE|nr:hypothetical protein [Nannocystis exedens]